MHPLHQTRSFATRYPLIGSILWLSTIQYFFVQVIVASAWSKLPYSWHLNAISDLATIGCGPFDDRFICSPLHGLMNASFIVLGISMTIGSLLLYQQLRLSRVGFSLMGLAGIGTILVGLFPEDTIYWAHITGADVAFLCGNIALIVFGLTLRLPCWLKWYSLASGVVALVAMVLFLTHNRFFFGLGGMERLVAYPQTIWLIVMGFYFSASRQKVRQA